MGNKHSVYRSTAEMVYICHDVLNRIAFIITGEVARCLAQKRLIFCLRRDHANSYLLQKLRNWQHYCRHAGNPWHKMGCAVQW